MVEHAGVSFRSQLIGTAFIFDGHLCSEDDEGYGGAVVVGVVGRSAPCLVAAEPIYSDLFGQAKKIDAKQHAQ